MAQVRDLMEDTKTLPVLTGPDRVAVQVALRETQALYHPASPEQIAAVLAELSFLPQRNAGEHETAFKVAVFTKALASLPRWALVRAVSEWIKAEKWFPTPSELHAIASKHIGKARWREQVMTRWLAQEAPRIESTSDAPITVQEVSVMQPHMVAIGLRKGWITQEVADEAERIRAERQAA